MEAPDTPDLDRTDMRFPRAWFVSLIGLSLIAVVGVHLFSEHFPKMHSVSDPLHSGLLLVEAVGMIGPPVGLIYLGAAVAARRYTSDVEWNFVLWTLLGLIAVSSVITGIAIHRTLNDIQVIRSLFVMELLTGAGVGGLLGAIAGMSRANTLDERKTVESQRDAFLFLNKLLRHHVLNSITVIEGFAERTRNHVNGTGDELLDTIHDHAENVTGLVRNVDTVVQTYTGAPSRRSMDLQSLIEPEIEQVRTAHPEVSIHSDLKPVQAEGNQLLAIAFRNLLDNAAMYNTADSPRVVVSMTEDSRCVTVSIKDNGPGIPEEDRARVDELGERGDRGIGLYLANRLISQLGGELTIDTEDGTGTTVEATLPKPDGTSESVEDWPIAPPIGQVD